MTETTSRLHITPLTPDLLPAILGVAASKLATDISYHSLQTFPEHGYGYVNLPAMEAEKIKKKINGAILRGKKVKVEEARPKKRKYTEENKEAQQQDEEEGTKRARLPTRERKESKRERNVTQGRELSPDRKVKRGWTETKSEQSRKKKEKSKSQTKSQTMSKFTEKEELLFKTKVPKNKASGKQRDEKRKKGTPSDTKVVHEFEKSTTVPSFLRDSGVGRGKAAAYEDDKGWIDQDGNVVEGEERRVSKRRKAARHGVEQEVVLAQPPRKASAGKGASRESTPSAEESSSNSSSQNNADIQNNDADEETSSSESDAETDETSSSGSSTSDSTEEGQEAGLSLNGDTAKSTKNTPSPPFVHPLEALFKKPTKPASSQLATHSQDNVKPSLEVQTTFAFFETNDDNLPPMPMTPFSSQDLRSRELRSAAPTPDTAHPSRMSSIFNGEDSDGELSEMEDYDIPNNSQVRGQQSSSANDSLPLPQTDFEKQFWEKRGENNRAWKARRRTVLKEKRQRENRARRPKNY